MKLPSNTYTQRHLIFDRRSTPPETNDFHFYKEKMLRELCENMYYKKRNDIELLRIQEDEPDLVHLKVELYVFTKEELQQFLADNK